MNVYYLNEMVGLDLLFRNGPQLSLLYSQESQEVIFVGIISMFLLSFNHYDLKSLLQQEKTKEDTHQTTLVKQSLYFLLFLCLLLG